jgi:hypothetical protein
MPDLEGKETYGEEEARKEGEMREMARQASIANPFDSRSEVSADARHIVKHLWIIFVLLPVVLSILFWVLTAAGK